MVGQRQSITYDDRCPAWQRRRRVRRKSSPRRRHFCARGGNAVHRGSPVNSGIATTKGGIWATAVRGILAVVREPVAGSSQNGPRGAEARPSFISHPVEWDSSRGALEGCAGGPLFL